MILNSIFKELNKNPNIQLYYYFYLIHTYIYIFSAQTSTSEIIFSRRTSNYSHRLSDKEYNVLVLWVIFFLKKHFFLFNYSFAKIYPQVMLKIIYDVLIFQKINNHWNSLFNTISSENSKFEPKINMH